MQSCTVQKRDGSTMTFDDGKLMNVILRVFEEGVNSFTPEQTNTVTATVIELLMALDGDTVTTETINDNVERAFMMNGFYDEGRRFILHREQNKNIRKMSADKDAMSEYIFTNRYSRHLSRKRRRETWDEAVDRVRDMHLRKYPKAKKDIIWAFEQVRTRLVLPSMRSMQFGGEPIERKNARMYNCSYSPADRVDFFRESMYLLLCGSGVGFSVLFEDVAKLPVVQKPSDQDIKHHIIADSIEGWSDAIGELMNSYFEGYTVEFIYKKVRKAGAKIRSGGNAPGHIPLRKSLEKIRNILDGAVDRKMKPIEVYDIVMHTADAVLSGGVRRSATICLFSHDDDEMMNSKTGEWLKDNPQRGRSNNSAKLLRGSTSREQFMRLFEKQKEFGEPGFFWVDDLGVGTNPCCEIGFYPYLPAGYVCESGRVLEEKTSAFQFCNLVTTNGAMITDKKTYTKAIKAATIIGTCQAGYVDFDYLDELSSEICKKEALLGVSITGMMDNPDVILNPENQREMAQLAIDVNKSFAKKIGVGQAHRITCVKPEGSSSILLNTASGIHPRYDKKYFRRIQANVNDPVYKHFKEMNPHCCEPSQWSTNGTDDVITFCVTAPENAIVKDDINAIQFLETVKSTQQNWVIPGTAIPNEFGVNINHNVSNTCTFKEEESEDVANFIYDNREFFTGVSLLKDDSTMLLMQAPHQQLRSHDDEAAWSNFMEGYQTVDYTQLDEEEDTTNHGEAGAACAGGKCDISITV